MVVNVSRVSAACDLYDKLTATSQAHYTALNALRSELYAAIFDGFTPQQMRRDTLPSTCQQQQRASFLYASVDYNSLTPYFVQTARLREAVQVAQGNVTQLRNTIQNHSSAVTTARKIVQTMMDQHKQSLIDLVFSLWADHTFLMNNRAFLALQMFVKGEIIKLKATVLMAWHRRSTTVKVQRLQKMLEVFFS
jgi:hypothetical protein